MKTVTTKFEKLLEESTSLYNSEKVIAGLLSTLLSKSIDDCLNEGVARETDDNRRQCARLEGFMAALDQVLAKKCENEGLATELCLLLKRITRHDCFGYPTAISVAVTRGEFETADQLHQLTSRRTKLQLQLN
jgi:hypothetical protein